MDDKIVVKNLYKVFGDRPEQAMRLLKDGVDKDEIFDKTGQTVGVCDASFSIKEGEIFVIMGLSGSGKSTMVRLLNRLIEPTSGNVFYGDKDIAAMSAAELRELRRKDMSMVFQSFALMPHMNVVENTAFGLELSGIEPQEREERALQALEQVGLAAYAESYPDELSGGMQQRVGLARALANDPAVMLMDEAFSALDPLIRTEMQDELLTLQSKHKRTVIFISHDLDEAMRIGDRIAIMQGGVVVQVGTPEDILNNPANDYVASFFRGVDVSNVLTVGDVAQKKQATVIEREGMGIKAALMRLDHHGRDFGYVIGTDLRYHGTVSVDTLNNVRKLPDKQLHMAFMPEIEPLTSDTLLSDVLSTVAKAPCGVPVINDDGKYMGVVTRAILLETLAQSEENAHA